MSIGLGIHSSEMQPFLLWSPFSSVEEAIADYTAGQYLRRLKRFCVSDGSTNSAVNHRIKFVYDPWFLYPQSS
jgi:hypothetical protein